MAESETEVLHTPRSTWAFGAFGVVLSVGLALKPAAFLWPGIGLCYLCFAAMVYLCRKEFRTLYGAIMRRTGWRRLPNDFWLVFSMAIVVFVMATYLLVSESIASPPAPPPPAVTTPNSPGGNVQEHGTHYGPNCQAGSSCPTVNLNPPSPTEAPAPKHRPKHVSAPPRAVATAPCSNNTVSGSNNTQTNDCSVHIGEVPPTVRLLKKEQPIPSPSGTGYQWNLTFKIESSYTPNNIEFVADGPSVTGVQAVPAGPGLSVMNGVLFGPTNTGGQFFSVTQPSGSYDVAVTTSELQPPSVHVLLNVPQ